MAEGDKEILQQFVDVLVPQLQAVSKGFAPTIEGVVTDKTAIIYASPYIRTLIDGRGPTRSGAKRGSPTLQQTIKDWIERNSIAPRAGQDGKIPTVEQLSWMISRSIHAHGTVLYQQGGGNNIFDTIITEDRIDNLLNLVGEKYFNEVQAINIGT